MKKLLITLIAIVLIVGCEGKKQILPSYNAEVLSYDSKKIYCSYGWMIRMGNDTILSTSYFLIKEVGFDIARPVKINIEIVSKEDFCKYPYCEIKPIPINLNRFN